MPLPNFSQLRPNQMAIVLVVGLGVVLLLGSFFYLSRGGESAPPAAISVWGTDDQQAFYSVITAYKGIRPNVTVKYTEVDPANYDRDLLDALAAGEGPDVFMIDGHDLGSTLSKIVPAPTLTMDVNRLREFFPKAIEQDMVVGGEVYGLPLYMDTLALLYNKDALDAGGIVTPPRTWEELQESVPSLGLVNEQGQVVRSAVTLGGSNRSIPEATDVLQLLMLQNGAMLATASSTDVDFGSEGEAAFNFYLQFANPVSPYYTWSDTFGNSVQRFAKGDVAMMFGYSSTLDAVKRQNPFLDVRVAPMVQAAGGTPRTYPRYQALVVSKQSKEQGWAWDFVANVTGSANAIQPYLSATQHPPALNALIEKAGADEAGLFTKQSLTARSWYHVDGASVAGILDRAIQDASTGVITPDRALRTAEDQISVLFRR